MIIFEKERNGFTTILDCIDELQRTVHITPSQQQKEKKQMENGDVNEFVDGLYYGDERWFRYNGIKYFIQGWVEKGQFSLMLDQMEPDPNYVGYAWSQTKPVAQRQEVVDAFLTDKIFNGKTFWEVEKDITWIEEWE